MNQISDEIIINQIFIIRGQKVMFDRDLAVLYGIPTKHLKQAVRRNMKRFPQDFMFELNKEELQNWRSQIVTSKTDKMGLRHAPFCFTEQGVAMLACILNSDRAIEVNIRIIRIFVKIRELISTHRDLLLKLEQLEKTVNRNDEEINMIFSVLKKLINPPQMVRKRIGFRRSSEIEEDL